MNSWGICRYVGCAHGLSLDQEIDYKCIAAASLLEPGATGNVGYINHVNSISLNKRDQRSPLANVPSPKIPHGLFGLYTNDSPPKVVTSFFVGSSGDIDGTLFSDQNDCWSFLRYSATIFSTSRYCGLPSPKVDAAFRRLIWSCSTLVRRDYAI